MTRPEIKRLLASFKKVILGKYSKWILAILFTLLGPLSIYYFKSPGEYPVTLPVLNAHHTFDKPIPLSISIRDNFDASLSLDLAQCKDSLRSPIAFLLPSGAEDVILMYGSTMVDLASDDSIYYKKYEETLQVQVIIEPEDFKRLNQINQNDTDLHGIFLRFNLKDHFIHHSYSSKSFILFYLSMAGNSKAFGKSVSISLETPINLMLNNSIPSPERILTFDNHLVYDFQNDAEDSGLLFNFTDNSKSIFEEISLFIISSFFGFFTGVIIEHFIVSQKK